MNYLDKHIEKIKSICSRNDVKTLFAFGSVLREDFSENSDIDLLVDIEDKDPITYSDKYFDLKFNLQDLFNRDIDLLETRGLRNSLLKESIDKNKVIIYSK
jgi:uncharacterized protein